MSRLVVAALLVCLAIGASADCYMHNPRGSNNKFKDQNENTQNQNRLFDSQNNAQGGYMWGPSMTFYSGSLLQVEWTSQHGCGVGHNNVDCNMVLQYMCGPWIRDGSTDNTPDPANQSPDDLAASGMHEPYSWYQDCQTRSRNLGVFTADRVSLGNLAAQSSATQDRQNNNGNKHGLECPEERDYYPYWAPTPWKDIAVLTSNTARCSWYQSNSQNVVPKSMCVVKNSPNIYPTITYDPVNNVSSIPNIWGYSSTANNAFDCAAQGNTWVSVPSWSLPAPDCSTTLLSRDNHLGNVYVDGQIMTNTYKWVIPSTQPDTPSSDPSLQYSTCVLRIRYNISSEDYKGFGHIDQGLPMIDYKYNDANSPVRNNPTISYGRDASDPSTPDVPGQLRNLTLAMNTAQYGRTFQDRTHVFYIKPRPSSVPAATRIFNLNVRGRRGNIVQCYPAVEYDFTPNNLQIAVDDLIHFQWTGSDNNANDAGEGTDGTDRSNIVQISMNDINNDARRNYPMSIDMQTMFATADAFRMAHLDQPPFCATETSTGCCLTDVQLSSKHNGNTNDINEDIQNCRKLNAASPYFDGGLISMSPGVYQYMSTRNNNFTNRSQKGTITVTTRLPAVALTGVVVGSAGFVGAAVVAGGVWYSKTHAASAAANVFGSVKI
jgi:hypothetical protein